MPRKKPKPLTLKEQEKRFVELCIDTLGEASPTDEQIAKLEKRAELNPGSGRKILKRPTVKLQMHVGTEPLRLAQAHQKALIEAEAKAAQSHQQALVKSAESVKLQDIQLPVLDDLLMQMCLGLNMHRFPKEKLDCIKAAYVVHGTIEANNSRRIVPAESAPTGAMVGIYTSLFNRLPITASKPESAPESPISEAAPLYPVAKPTPAEIIPPAIPAKDSKVITVEIG